MTELLVRAQGLRKVYGRRVALDTLDLSVAPGQVLGLLGPNGAGKTTAVKLLLGLTRPNAGGGEVLGRPLGDRNARRSIGYLPELFRYPPWLSVGEVMRLHCRLAGLATDTWDDWTLQAMGIVGLMARGRDRVGDLSKGLQQRLGLGLALLGDPRLVILDEPTSALDPVGRDDVRAIIRAARARGAGVILNSHLLGEVERVCDEVVIVHRGRAIAAGGLRRLLGAPSLRLSVSGLADPVAVVGRFAPVVVEPAGLLLHPFEPERTPDVVEAVVAAGGRIHAVEPVQRSLEDLFLELIRTGVTEATESFRLPTVTGPLGPGEPPVAGAPPGPADTAGTSRPGVGNQGIRP
jgi:ABC-2 type transport system ATP-binding protein